MAPSGVPYLVVEVLLALEWV